MFLRSVFAALAIATTSFVPSAQASSCADRTLVVERLQSKYAEQLTASGLQYGAQADALVEIWTSPDTGTFTVLVTLANGTTCILAAGTNFFNEDVSAEAAGIRS
jgi:hypothetical protein